MRKRKSNGYIEVYAPDHPNRHKSTGFIYEHRFVMSNHLGRPLRKGEIVHHKDENRKNNDLSNLVLAGSIASHKVLHRSPKSKRLQLPEEANPIIKCLCGCGKEFLKYDSIGRERRYARGGHGRKGKHYFDLTIKVKCACGCGMTFSKFDKWGRIRKYISGHNSIPRKGK
jgi:hypothetical protein